MRTGDLSKIEIKPITEERRFQFRLWFHEDEQAVEFGTTFEHAMIVMTCLQEFQAKHKIPIPHAFRRKGKPSLVVVTDDD